MQLCICESPAELNEFRGKYTKKGEGLGSFIRQGDDLLVCCCCCFFSWQLLMIKQMKYISLILSLTNSIIPSNDVIFLMSFLLTGILVCALSSVSPDVTGNHKHHLHYHHPAKDSEVKGRSRSFRLTGAIWVLGLPCLHVLLAL